jgi:hypothetical protein
MPRVIFHIEELVLSGFAPGERYRIGDALQSALIESLAGDALPLPASMQSLDVEMLAPQRVILATRSNAAEIGTGVVSALLSGIAEALVLPRGGES